MKIYWSGDSKNIIGAKVRALRLEKKWSQHDLATKVQLLGCETLHKALLDAEDQVISHDIIPDEPISSAASAEN